MDIDNRENRRKIRILLALKGEQVSRLNRLSKSTRVLRSVYLREAVDDLLRKYAKEAKKGG
ncbi:MAG: ribbon-helix-helix domain-containing protein [Nitrospirae bacterium]|nr:ribbon-helix-helix domain-containing protein [Nitrospirota bacterium]